jgi:hypothetical protein
MMTNNRPAMQATSPPPAGQSEVGPVLSVPKAQAPGVKVGDQCTVSGVATVTEVGEMVSLQMMQVDVAPDDQGAMKSGFDAGSAADEMKG